MIVWVLVSAGRLLPFRRDGRWGYVYADGAAEAEVAIEPRFAEAADFHDGLARVNVGEECEDHSDTVVGRWGFIDASGKFRLDPIYDGAGDFSDGLACVHVDARKGYAPYESRHFVTGGRWGFVDANGWHIPAKYECATGFSEGVAGVRKDELYGFIDRADRLMIPHVFRTGGLFREGLAPVSVSVNKKDVYGYVDRGGKLVIEPRWRLAYPFSEGLGLVLDGATYRYVFLDSGGEIAVRMPPSIGHALPFSEGLAGASVTEIRPFNDRSGFYPMSGGRFGFVDRSGSFVIEPQFEWASSFRGGLAPAKKDGRCGYVDPTGAFVIEPQFDGAGPVTCGLGQVTRGNNVFYLDLRKYGKGAGSIRQPPENRS